MSAAGPPSMRPRQELAVRRFTQYCKDDWWGRILFHKVGTGKTMTSLLIALNSFTDADFAANRKIIIVSPSQGIFQNFIKDLSENLINWSKPTAAGPAKAKPEDILVSYPYAELIEDINDKNWRQHKNMEGSIWIFDEAHRMVGKEVFNSREAGSRTEKHPIIEDIFFVNKMKKAKRCIVMTGTPIQVDVADICRLLNFVSRSNDFQATVFAPVQILPTLKQWALTIYINGLKAVAGGIAARTLADGTEIISTTVGPYLPEMPEMPEINSYMTVAFTLIFLLATSILLYGNTEIIKRRMKPIQSRGGTRKMKGGNGEEKESYLNFLAGQLTPFLNPITIAQLTAGPSGGKKTFLEKVGAFGVDAYIASFQEVTEELYRNHWMIEELAKKASPYISVYDPDIQMKLRSDPVAKIYDSPALAQVTANTFLNFQDKTPALDMPLKVYTMQEIFYTKEQYDLLVEMFAGEATYTTSAIFNLDRYEAKSPDPKTKFKFFRTFARMIGNYSTDMKQYYTVINEKGDDYLLFNRETGEEVVVAVGKPIFKCPKFEHCLNSLIAMRQSGQMMDPTTKGLIPQPHFDADSKQYLPLVYSYTEDYGLGPFCIFLKSMGYTYILAHTKQPPTKLVETVKRGKSTPPTKPVEANAQGFPKLVDKETPLCILIHPTMTEGYDFVYNPAIFVLEPCNTFGDQEQVYGRVLRSYSKADVDSIERGGGQRKKKLVVQYGCVMQNESKILTKFNMVSMKAASKRSRMFFTPQQYFTAFQKAKIISPDFYAITRLKEEEVYLKQFEEGVRGAGKPLNVNGEPTAIHFSNLFESMTCLSDTVKPVREALLAANPGMSEAEADKQARLTVGADMSCDPMSGVSCAKGGRRRRWRTRKNK